MKTTLVAIGNSRGIRIPKALIEQCGLERDLERLFWWPCSAADAGALVS